MNTNVFPQTEGAEQKIKSYWNRPGGKFGTIIGLAYSPDIKENQRFQEIIKEIKTII